MAHSPIPRHHLLLLLDEPVLSDLTAFRLELLGYSVLVSSDGDDALKRIEDQRPALLLLNSNLGEQDGLIWLTKLRARISPEDLPVLIISLDPSLDTVRRSFEAGAQDYLISPFDPTVLERKVANFVDADQISAEEERRSGMMVSIEAIAAAPAKLEPTS
ncbi:MAG: response regulator [Planctomycetota bacterium]